MVKCPNCGYIMNFPAKYCVKCGFPLEKKEEKIKEEKAEIVVEEKKEKKKMITEAIKKIPLVTSEFIDELLGYAKAEYLKKKKTKLLEQINSLMARAELEGEEAVESEVKALKEEVLKVREEMKKVRTDEPPWEKNIQEVKKVSILLDKLEDTYKTKKITTQAYTKLKVEYENRLKKAKEALYEFKQKLEGALDYLKGSVMELRSEIEIALGRLNTGEITKEEFRKIRDKKKEKIEEAEFIDKYIRNILTRINALL